MAESNVIISRSNCRHKICAHCGVLLSPYAKNIAEIDDRGEKGTCIDCRNKGLSLATLYTDFSRIPKCKECFDRNKKFCIKYKTHIFKAAESCEKYR